jgi:hypothetical protein
MKTSAVAIVLAIVTFAGGMLTTPVPAQAQGGSCYALWHERNGIYARNGYCFRTPRAIAEFGRGCFPPYGRLSGWEARRVREIQDEEYARGCPQ